MSNISDKVQKLLAKAQDESVSEQEAEAYLAKAAQLMMEYNIDAALLAAKAKVFLYPTSKVLFCVPQFAAQKTTLMGVIARSFSCKAILTKNAARNKGIAEVTVFGFENDIDSVSTIYSSAVVIGEIGSARRRNQGNTSRGYHSSYWAGYANGIMDQLDKSSEETRKTAVVNDSGADIVLRDRSTAVNDLLNKTFPSLRNIRRTTSNRDGFYAGKSDGVNANLFGRNTVSSNRAEIGAGK
jgi:Protein of unknown function (DUF2786)